MNQHSPASINNYPPGSRNFDINNWQGRQEDTRGQLTNLHPNSAVKHVSLFNVIFSKNIYPTSGEIAIILSFLKSDSDPTLPISYRLIELLSVSMNDYSDTYNQTISYLSSNTVFAKDVALLKLLQIIVADFNSCLYSVFFDLQEGFPLV